MQQEEGSIGTNSRWGTKRRSEAESGESERDDFTLGVLWENTVVGTDARWISVRGICGDPFKIEMRADSFV